MSAEERREISRSVTINMLRSVTGLLTILSIGNTCYATLKCNEGEFLHPLKYVCQRCTICTPGYYAQSSCGESDDTVCLPCANKTYSKESTYSSNTCTNCTLCDVYKTRCKSSQDAVCEKTERIDRGSSNKGLIIATVLSTVVFICLVLCLLIALYIRRKRARARLPASELEAMRPNGDGGDSREGCQE